MSHQESFAKASPEESFAKACPEESLQHPFITNEFAETDNLYELENMGWKCIDVSGDGNCGYYCLILGLESNGNFNYSPRTPCNDSIMQNNTPWQDKIFSLHKSLQHRSEELLQILAHSEKSQHGGGCWMQMTKSQEKNYRKDF